MQVQVRVQVKTIWKKKKRGTHLINEEKKLVPKKSKSRKRDISANVWMIPLGKKKKKK